MKIYDYEVPENTRELLTDSPPVLPFFDEMNFQTTTNSAGKNGQSSGDRHEKITESIITGVQNKKFELTKKPKYIDYMGLFKQGDYKIHCAKGGIHIECKQLSNFGSHLEKVSYILFNLFRNPLCYGRKFWLVYDHDDDLTDVQYDKLEKLEVQFRILQEKLAVDGVYIDMIPIKSLYAYTNELNEELGG